MFKNIIKKIACVSLSLPLTTLSFGACQPIEGQWVGFYESHSNNRDCLWQVKATIKRFKADYQIRLTWFDDKSNDIRCPNGSTQRRMICQNNFLSFPSAMSNMIQFSGKITEKGIEIMSDSLNDKKLIKLQK